MATRGLKAHITSASYTHTAKNKSSSISDGLQRFKVIKTSVGRPPREIILAKDSGTPSYPGMPAEDVAAMHYARTILDHNNDTDKYYRVIEFTLREGNVYHEFIITRYPPDRPDGKERYHITHPNRRLMHPRQSDRLLTTGKDGMS